MATPDSPPTQASPERWSSRWGVILAVAGSAVGLGNYLRFPGLAAKYGGGAFMLAYGISFLIIGLPICWAEWTLGRMGGARGFNSAPGILNALWKWPGAKYVGVIGVVIPLVIYMYYVYIEAWCLGYAVNYLFSGFQFHDVKESTAFFDAFIGASANGAALHFGRESVGWYVLIVMLLNYYFIFRGLSQGIERFCRYALPALVLIALVVLVRVLTLGTPDPSHAERSVANGLGFLWNPDKVELQQFSPETGQWVPIHETSDPGLLSGDAGSVAGLEERAALLNERVPNSARVRVYPFWEQLAKPDLWLAAASQIFFSLSVGFGVILNYASYLRKSDDVVLSGLTATAANEFCEVAQGGMITVPAAVVYFGVAGVAGIGAYDLGFKVLPMVFVAMPAGRVFGFLFFFLLFLAANTSALSLLQPGVAFLEEALELERKRSVALLAIMTMVGTGFVWYCSRDLKALSTLDFWAGTLLIYIFSTVQIILFAWIIGVDRGFREAHAGAAIQIPRIFRCVMRFLCPAFLLAVFVAWLGIKVIGLGGQGLSSYVTDLIGADAPVSHPPNKVAVAAVGLIIVLMMFLAVITSGVKRYHDYVHHDEEGPS